jgi:peptidoglycan/LPS O-acetylase OafA/YrhL
MKFNIFGLGAFRLMLALFVAVSHLYSEMIHGPAAYAVWGFYLLSGYLMSLILNEKYGFNTKGLLAFFTNRAIRIYPAYLTALILGVCTLHYLNNTGISPQQFNPQFQLPQTWIHWLHVYTIFPFIPMGGLPVATSHALSLEVGMYLLAPLICRNKSSAFLCFILSVVSNYNLGFQSSSFAQRYATFLPCLLAFSAGSLLYHFRETFARFRMPFGSLMAWLLFCFIWLFYPSWPWTFGLYVSLILSAWVVISLVDFKSKSDLVMGDLSYPVYLFHTTIAAIVGTVFELKTRSLLFCLAGIIVTIIISYFIAFYIEKPARKIKISK